MARRSRSRSRSANAVGQRAHQLSGAMRSMLTVRVSPVDMRMFEDRRVFPRRVLVAPKRLVETQRRPRVIDAVPARMRERASGHFSFTVPRNVIVCVRRKQRREVLFAQRRTGKGARSSRRRNQWSDVRCR